VPVEEDDEQGRLDFLASLDTADSPPATSSDDDELKDTDFDGYIYG
jgi:hypothetical protein